VLVDLDQDAVPELVLPTAISGYEGGAEPIAVVPVVYRCSAGTCAVATKEFPEFLTQERNRRVAAFQAGRRGGSASAASVAACFVMEVAYLNRERGADPRSGFDSAVEWMASPDPAFRRKAIWLFEAIGDLESRQRLEALAADPDSTVADAARRRVEMLNLRAQ
jgi:hypothetical protein